MVDSVSVRFKNASGSKKCLENIRIQWNAEPLACRSASAKNASVSALLSFQVSHVIKTEGRFTPLITIVDNKDTCMTDTFSN